MTTAIHWFRRDLRVSDNTALAAAAESGARRCEMNDSAHRYKQNRFQQLRGFCHAAASGTCTHILASIDER